jgi:predicted ATPase
MIKSIRLKNFKCYRDSGEIPFAPLTVIVGCNNAGKSSIFQGVLALKQTLEDVSMAPRLITKGKVVDLGGFHDILHRGPRDSDTITIEVSRDPFGIRPPPRVKFREATTFSVEFSHDADAKTIRLHHLALSDSTGPVIERLHDGKWRLAGIPEKHLKRLDLALWNVLPQAEIKSGNLRAGKSPMTISESLVDALMSVQMQQHPWMHLFADLEYIKPLREHVPFYSFGSEQTPMESGVGAGASVMSLLAKNPIIKPSGEPLLDIVNTWMSDRFETLSKLKIEDVDKSGHIVSLTAVDHHSKTPVNIAAMGEGVSQIVPIVARVIASGSRVCLLIEQPEIHLHPCLQADLADLFVKIIEKSKRQIIIETHSEHMLLRLRTHIAKGDIAPESVSILYVEKLKGESKVRQLEVNGNGHFEDWPKGFFDQAYQEAMRLAMAQPVKKANRAGSND